MIYINQEGGHNKFWGYESYQDIMEWKVRVYWGPIGTDLDSAQTRIYEFNSEWQAEDFIDKKLREKKGKGYVPLKIPYAELIQRGQDDISDYIHDLQIDANSIKTI